MTKYIILFLCAVFLFNVLCLSGESDKTISQQYDEVASDVCELYKDYIVSEESKNLLYEDDTEYDNYYGRFYIKDVDIDVALYYGNKQSIVDRQDSAFIYDYKAFDGYVIGDHNSQGFDKLFDVEIGTTGCIKLENGGRIKIKCVDIYNGRNTGRKLTDTSGNVVMGTHEFLIYTCRSGWGNVLITQWEKY